MQLYADHHAFARSNAVEPNSSVCLPGPGLFYYQARRLNPPTKSKWESRLMTGIECCRLGAAIQASLDGIGFPASFSSSRMAA